MQWYENAIFTHRNMPHVQNILWPQYFIFLTCYIEIWKLLVRALQKSWRINKDEAEEAASECALSTSTVKDPNMWLEVPSPFTFLLFHFWGMMFLPLLYNKIAFSSLAFCWMSCCIFHHAVCEDLEWRFGEGLGCRVLSCYIAAACRYTPDLLCLKQGGRFTLVLCWGDKRITLLLAAVSFMSVLQSSWD